MKKESVNSCRACMYGYHNWWNGKNSSGSGVRRTSNKTAYSEGSGEEPIYGKGGIQIFTMIVTIQIPQMKFCR